MEPLRLNNSWMIPARDLSVRFVRSSGPGGQNVNKLSTKVELRLDLARTEALSEAQKARFASLYPGFVTKDGHVVLTGDEHRSQVLNLEATRRRLAEMVLRAGRAPAVRRPSMPTRAAKRRRLENKRHRARIKSQRSTSFD